MRTCKKCGEGKGSDEFQSNGAELHPYCKTCKNALRAAWCVKNPEKHLLYGAKRRARETGAVFSITAENFAVPKACPIFGTPLEVGGDRNSSPSLDRIDPARGYVPGNVAVISYRANRIKNDATAEELRAIASWMERVKDDGV